VNINYIIGDNKIGSNGTKGIGNGLQVNKGLTILNLGNRYNRYLIVNNQIKDEGAKDIGNALQYNTNLTKLYLGNRYNKYFHR
jgi:hypothetical protein